MRGTTVGRPDGPAGTPAHCVGTIGHHTGMLAWADGLPVGAGEDEGFDVQDDPNARRLGAVVAPAWRP